MTSLNLFLYGTLMPGQRADHLIPKNLIKVSVDASVKGVGMFNNNNAFPIVIIDDNKKNNQDNILGKFIKLGGLKSELDEVLTTLDYYENVQGGLFSRSLQDIFIRQGEDKSIFQAWIYSINPPYYEEVKRLPRVKNNDWTNRNKP